MDYQLENRKIIDDLINIEKRINELKKNIQRLEAEKEIQNKNVKAISEEVKEETIKEDTSSLEDELSFYIYNYRSLSSDFSENDLIMILPSKKHPKYQEILLRMAYDSFKEIREATNLKQITSSEDEKEIINEAINYEKRKMDFIKKILSSKEATVEEEIKNNIVLVPTTSNKIRIIEELEHIPVEYYDRFLELVNSIIDGTFKNVKTFKNNAKLMGISEVKGFQVRILFTRIGYNTYALISAFVKKTDIDKYYTESLEKKVFDYYLVEGILKEKLSSDEFISYNENNIDTLFDILGKPKKMGEGL